MCGCVHLTLLISLRLFLSSMRGVAFVLSIVSHLFLPIDLSYAYCRAPLYAPPRTPTPTLHISSLTQARKGMGFGELALLYDAPRAATVEATSVEGVRAWALDRVTFKQVMIGTTMRKVRRMPECTSCVETGHDWHHDADGNWGQKC